MGNITEQQHAELEEIMDRILTAAAKLKKIEGEYEFAENMRCINEMKSKLDGTVDKEVLEELESDMADMIETRFNNYLDNPKSELDNDVANIMSEYLEKSTTFTEAL